MERFAQFCFGGAKLALAGILGIVTLFGLLAAGFVFMELVGG